MAGLFSCEEERTERFLMACEAEEFDLKPEFEAWLHHNGFFTAPASTKYHGVYDGGLFDHSLTVMCRLQELTENNHLVWRRPQSPFIVGMFHDLCKCDQYKKVGGTVLMFHGTEITEPTGYHYEYNNDTILKGHGTKSVLILSQFMALTEEEMLCIRYHMGPYGNEHEQKDEWAGYDKAIRKYSTVLWTNHADMLASKVDDT